MLPMFGSRPKIVATAAVPAVILFDQFTDSDATALADHTIAPTNTRSLEYTVDVAAGTLAISDNKLLLSGEEAEGLFTFPLVATNYEVEMIRVGNIEFYIDAGESNQINIEFYDTQWRLTKFLGGEPTTLITQEGSFGTGEKSKIIKSGTSYSLWYGTNQVGETSTISDEVFDGEYTVIIGLYNNTTIDDLKVTA